MACDLCRSRKQKCTKSESETACQRCSRGGHCCNYIVDSERLSKPAGKSTVVQTSMSPSSTTPLIELPEDEQTSGKTSNSPGAASGQVNITYSTRTSDSERSFEASNHPTLASSSAEASLVQAIHAYNSHVQSAGQRQVEDTLRRLLDEKFSDLQKRRGQSNEERWLKAIDQICRAQHSLAKEVREMRLQLLRLGDLHRHAVSVSRSVTSSSNVEKGYHTPGPEQSVGTTGFAWDSVDHSGCMGSTMFSGNTVLNDGRWTDPYSRQ